MRLEERLSEYYRSKSLSPESLATILASPQTVPQRGIGRGLLVAAALLLLAGSVLFPTLARWRMERSVRQEVAINHLELKAVEFSGTEVGALDLAMQDLDFRLRESERLERRDLQLVGARYCSLDGKLAAQLQFVDPEGSRWTLYETPMTDRLARLEAGTGVFGDVAVDLWAEGDLLLALASESQSQFD